MSAALLVLSDSLSCSRVLRVAYSLLVRVATPAISASLSSARCYCVFKTLVPVSYKRVVRSRIGVCTVWSVSVLCWWFSEIRGLTYAKDSSDLSALLWYNIRTQRAHGVKMTSSWHIYDVTLSHTCQYDVVTTSYACLEGLTRISQKYTTRHIDYTGTWSKFRKQYSMRKNPGQWISPNIQCFEIDSEPMTNGLFLEYIII